MKTWLVKMERHVDGSVRRQTVRVWADDKMSALRKAEEWYKGCAVSARVES